jgi:hypothetical protein
LSFEDSKLGGCLVARHHLPPPHPRPLYLLPLLFGSLFSFSSHNFCSVDFCHIYIVANSGSSLTENFTVIFGQPSRSTYVNSIACFAQFAQSTSAWLHAWFLVIAGCTINWACYPIFHRRYLLTSFQIISRIDFFIHSFCCASIPSVL